MIKKYEDFLLEEIEKSILETDILINENILKTGINKFVDVVKKLNQQQKDNLQKIKDKQKELSQLAKEAREKTKAGYTKRLEIRRELIDSTTQDVRAKTEAAKDSLKNVEATVKAKIDQAKLDKDKLIQQSHQLKDKIKNTVEKKNEYNRNN